MSTGALMSIDFLTTVNICDSFQRAFKALHDFKPIFDLQYIDRRTSNIMNGILWILFILPLLFVSIPTTINAYGHSLFNSAEQTLGDYRVQIATQPEFPQIGERSQVLIRVTDQDGKEVERFMMGNRIFYNEEQIITWRPESYEGGHMEKDFFFEESGNHIFRVDLYDAASDGGVLTFSFNISTQSPFGYVFIGAIAAGGIIFGGVIGIVYVPRILKKRTKS